MAAFIPAILGGISALAGGFGNRPKTTTTTQDQTQTLSNTAAGTSAGTSQPLYDDQQLAIRNQIFQTLLGRLNQDPSLSGYTATGIQNINKAGDLRRQALENILAQRGLSSSPTAARAIANTESSRISDAVNFQNQIPLLADSLNRQRVGDLSSFFTSLPVGQTTQGSTNLNQSGTSHLVGKGTSTDPGNVAGGIFGSLGPLLGGLFGSGAFGKKTGSTPQPDYFGG